MYVLCLEDGLGCQ
jgi:hypothetical protein